MPAPSEAERLRQDLRDIKADLNNRLDNVNTAIKELAEATKELIRVDGDVRVLREAVGRIGKESEDHEERLRKLEGKPAKRYDKAVDRTVMLIIGAVVTFAVSKALGG